MKELEIQTISYDLEPDENNVLIKVEKSLSGEYIKDGERFSIFSSVKVWCPIEDKDNWIEAESVEEFCKEYGYQYFPLESFLEEMGL